MKSKNKKTVRKVLSSFKFYEEALDTGKKIKITIANKILACKILLVFNKSLAKSVRRGQSTILAKCYLLMGCLIEREVVRRKQKFNNF